MDKQQLIEALMHVSDGLLINKDKDKSKQRVLFLLLAYINDYKVTKLTHLIFDHGGNRRYRS